MYMCMQVRQNNCPHLATVHPTMERSANTISMGQAKCGSTFHMTMLVAGWMNRSQADFGKKWYWDWKSLVAVLLRYFEMMTMLDSFRWLGEWFWSLYNNCLINKIVNVFSLCDMFKTYIGNICFEIRNFLRKKHFMSECQKGGTYGNTLHYTTLHFSFWNHHISS